MGGGGFYDFVYWNMPAFIKVGMWNYKYNLVLSAEVKVSELTKQQFTAHNTDCI